MRYLNLLLGVTMLGFTAVQYNDPDALLWIVYYSVPAACALLAALRPGLLRTQPGASLLLASVPLWLGLVVFYWPQMPGFWRWPVLMAEETAREGMGLMVAWLTVLVAAFSVRTRTRPPT